VGLFRHGRRSRAIGYAVFALAILAIAGVVPGSVDRQRVKQFEFTSERPGTATGVEAIATFPGATPETAVSSIVTKLARGIELDTSVPVRCKATNEELVAQGQAACPPASRVGDGLIRLREFGVADVTLFNAKRETIFLIELRDFQFRTVGRETASGRTQRIEVMEGVTLKRIKLEIDRIRRGGENYLETPERCPDRGKWTNRGTFTYRDGVVQREKGGTPCEDRRD
jgi:hypothetical protein